jgi:hypothetical protein
VLAEAYSAYTLVPLEPGRGGDAVMCKCNGEDFVIGANNWGHARTSIRDMFNPIGPFDEGGGFSRFADAVPGQEAVAKLHDRLLNGLSTDNSFVNYSTMLPAAGFVYGGLAHRLAPEILIFENIRR